MAAVVDDDSKGYHRLVTRFPLRPIHTDEDNEKAARICDELTNRVDDLSPAERDYLEVLSDLIIKYESERYRDDKPMLPRKLIEYLMEENDLRQKDLIPELGSESRVSEFLSGKRPLSLEQAKKLSQRFKIKLEALL